MLRCAVLSDFTERYEGGGCGQVNEIEDTRQWPHLFPVNGQSWFLGI